VTDSYHQWTVLAAVALAAYYIGYRRAEAESKRVREQLAKEVLG